MRVTNEWHSSRVYATLTSWHCKSRPKHERQIYVEQLVTAVAARTQTTFPGAANGVTITTGVVAAAAGAVTPTNETCAEKCRMQSNCRAVSWVSDKVASGYNECTLLSFVESTNRDARYTTTVFFENDASPAAGWFFDDVDWGVCGAIRQYSTDPAARYPSLTMDSAVLGLASQFLFVSHRIATAVRRPFLTKVLHSRMPLVPTPARLKLLHACAQWQSSRVSTASYRFALKIPSKRSRSRMQCCLICTMERLKL
jgi:hypothetical protein